MSVIFLVSYQVLEFLVTRWKAARLGRVLDEDEAVVGLPKMSGESWRGDARRHMGLEMSTAVVQSADERSVDADAGKPRNLNTYERDYDTPGGTTEQASRWKGAVAKGTSLGYAATSMGLGFQLEPAFAQSCVVRRAQGTRRRRYDFCVGRRGHRSRTFRPDNWKFASRASTRRCTISQHAIFKFLAICTFLVAPVHEKREARVPGTVE
ncbi:hypothetical protein C8R45DRAFT_1143973 [Mycena sanguinolenta]|nr:hypothetical protein C8R45DRAFT_1143973 [Mycena sanguinolenta]